MINTVKNNSNLSVLFVSLGGESPNAAPPLGMLYLSSIAKAKGCAVIFNDASFTGNQPDHFEQFLLKLKDSEGFTPDICGFTLFTINLLDSYDFAAIVKSHFPDCKVIVGGPHATALPERTMKECELIEYLVYGEGENTFSELIDAINGNRSLESVDGIYYRNNNEIAHTPPRKYIDDLDSIPFPAYDLLPKEYPYKKYDSLNLGDTGAPIITSRGCPFECTFCYKDIFGTKFRRRSVKNVVAEIKLLIDQYNINNIFFEDDFFAVNKKWLGDFYEEMRVNGIKVPWRCQGRVDTLSRQDYIAMKQNGCYHITFGVESGNDEVLIDIKKKINVKQTIATFNEVKKTGLVVMGNFIFGHRKDTQQTIIDTLKVAQKANPDTVSFLCLAPIPGSEAYSYLPDDMKYAWTKHGGYTGNASKLPISICSLSAEELKDFKDKAQIKYYSRYIYLLENVLFPRNFNKPFLALKFRAWADHEFLFWEGKFSRFKFFNSMFGIFRQFVKTVSRKSAQHS